MTFAGAFAFGSMMFYIFWVVAFFELVALSYFSNHKGWFSGTVFLVLSFAAMSWLHIFNLKDFVVGHPGDAVKMFIGYILSGAVWSTFKWWLYNRKVRLEYNERKAIFLRNRNVSELTPQLKMDWWNQRGIHIPNAMDYKETIITWLYLWPFSVLGTLLNDFLRKLYDHIYNAMTGVYARITASVWVDIEKDRP